MTALKQPEALSRFVLRNLMAVTGLILLFLNPAITSEAVASNETEGRPITEFLDEKGHFQNPEGYSGAVDLTGFSMAMKEAGAPVFMMDEGGDPNDNWTLESVEPGVNNAVRAFFVNGDDLFLGGDFTSVGGVAANRIARYDIATGSWHTLGDGVDNTVRTLTLSGGDLYVGGNFTSAGGVEAIGIARYDLAADIWHALGDGLIFNDEFNGTARALAVSGDDLYVGGGFTSAGGVSADRIARYDMASGSWHALGNGVSGSVFALSVSGNNLFVGGQFTSANGAPASRIARYDMSSGNWHALGDGVDHSVEAIVVSGDNLFVGGNFSSAGGVAANRLARYNLSSGSWSSLGDVVNDGAAPPMVFVLAVSGDDLYVGGQFTSVDGVTVNRIARYDILAETWNTLSDGVNSNVQALAVSGDDLYVGGFFTSAGSVAVSRIARFDLAGESWFKIGGDGLNNSVNALAVSGNDLYVGGVFSDVDGVEVNSIARYDMASGSWHALGNGVGGSVFALSVSGDDLYVGGGFTSAGGVAADRIARYDMSAGSWHTLGDGVNSTVLTLVVIGEDLYVGGLFTSAGGVSADRIARYDMASGSWYALGDGVNSTVRALSVTGEDLYVGGNFTSAGGLTANRIARYDMVSGSWHALGNGVSGSVFALSVSGEDLYVGGQFTSAGGVAADRIARYDMSSGNWHTLGDGVDNSVSALFMSGNDLYVGGLFTNAGGAPANNIARYDMVSGSWHVLGDGVNSRVNALRVSNEDMYVGGAFTIAGNKPASRLARWSGLLSPPGKVTISFPETESSGITLQPVLSWDILEFSDSYEIEIATSPGFTAPVLSESGISGESFQPDTELNRGVEYFWRVRGVNDAGPGEWSTTFSFTTHNFPSGSGTEADPFLITDIGQLQEIKYNLDSHYRLGNDIDASATESWNGGEGFEPLGDGTNPFTGSLDGDEFTLSNLFIDRRTTNEVGLFAVAENTTITRLNIESMTLFGRTYAGIISRGTDVLIDQLHVSDVSIDAGRGSVGGLIGRAFGASQIRHSSASGEISTELGSSGGVAGLANEDVALQHTSFSGTVHNSRGNRAGGLVAQNFGTIENSHADAAITGFRLVGGVAGTNDGLIHQSYFTGTITESRSRSREFGGIAGINNADGVISESYSLANSIEAENIIGGLAGSNLGTIENSYSTSAVMFSGDTVGGFIGRNMSGATISNSYTAGTVEVDAEDLQDQTGGFAGLNEGTITGSFWNMDLYEFTLADVGEGSDNGVLSRTQTDLKLQPTFTAQGWDFDETWSIEQENRISYPFLQETSQDPLPGLREEPFVVLLSNPENDGTDVSREPILEWEESLLSDRYQIQLFLEEIEGSPVLDIETDGSLQLEITEQLEGSGLYLWRVRGINTVPGEAVFGEWSEAFSFTTLPEAPVQVVLSSPANEAEDIGLQPTLEWEAANGALTYELEFSQDSGWDDSELFTITDGTSYSFTNNLANSLTFFWRVRGVNAGGNGEWSTPYSFKTIPEVSDAISLLSPQDGVTDVLLEPELVWVGETGAETYNLELAESLDFDTPLVSATDHAETSYQVSTTLERETMYHWRVQGVNAGGVSEWSETFSFTTIPDIPGEITLLSPENDAEDIEITSALEWSGEANSEQYQLQLATLGDFETVLLDTTLSGTELNGYSFEYASTYYWRVAGENVAGRGNWGEARSFVTEQIPIPVNLKLANENGNFVLNWDLSTSFSGTSQRIYRGNEVDEMGLHEEVDSSGRSYIDEDGVPEAKVFYAVSAVDQNGNEGELSGVVSFTSPSYQFTEQWDLVSIPVEASEIDTEGMEIFGFSRVYQSVNALAAGNGYWVRSESDKDLTLEGSGITEKTLSLNRGWNLIGGLSGTVNPSEIDDPDEILTTAPTFSYSEGMYVEAGRFDPGVGYWLYALDSGEVFVQLRAIIESEPSKIVESAERDDVDVYHRVTFTSEDLEKEFFISEDGLDQDQKLRYILPPKAPVSTLDVRTPNGFRITDRVSEPVEIDAHNYPVSAEMILSEELFDADYVYRFVARDGDNEIHFNLLDKQPVIIDREYDSLILERVHVDEIILDFAIAPNFPNPFNPATTIRYQLASPSDVRLDVFDVIGRRVATLVNSSQQAGVYNVTFDASMLASGIYLLRIHAGENVSVQKMTLIK